MTAQLAELKDALSPDSNRLPEDTRRDVIAHHGARIGEKTLRNIAETSAQPYQIECLRPLLDIASKKDILHAANGKKRRHILHSALLQIDHPLAEEMTREALESLESDALGKLVQALPRAVRPMRFAPELRIIAATPGHPCWGFAVRGLGTLGDEEACLLLMEQIDETEKAKVILGALRSIGSDFCRPAFFDVLGHPVRDVQLQGLWGLGKLGVDGAIPILVALLDDPDIRTDRRSRPGLARRAAQALADIHGWDMEWTPEDQARISAKARTLYPAAKVPETIAAHPDLAVILHDTAA